MLFQTYKHFSSDISPETGRMGRGGESVNFKEREKCTSSGSFQMIKKLDKNALKTMSCWYWRENPWQVVNPNRYN